MSTTIKYNHIFVTEPIDNIFIHTFSFISGQRMFSSTKLLMLKKNQDMAAEHRKSQARGTDLGCIKETKWKTFTATEIYRTLFSSEHFIALSLNYPTSEDLFFPQDSTYYEDQFERTSEIYLY